MRMRNRFFELFKFSKKERVAIFLLLIISSLAWIIPGFFSIKKINPEWITVTPLELDERVKALNSRRDSTHKINRSWNDHNNNSIKPSLFQFDPNQVSKEDLIKLGIPERVSNSIINYRMKGGRFKVADDLRKIYGLSTDLANQVIPYAVISDSFNATSFSAQHNGSYFKPVKININIADSTAFAGLPGIGSRLSSRIVRYRERLGGFYELNQLREVYGMNDSILKQIDQKIHLDHFAVNRININEVDYEELSRHPYIGYSKARLLIAFRKVNGKIKNKDELIKAALYDSIGVEKILPYCSFD
jgi:competence ComEA-like helix-hairpin-helix protein